MKLKQLLTESDDEMDAMFDDEMDVILKAAAIIRHDCQPFIEASKMERLYRGGYWDGELLTKKRVRKNRMPVNASKELTTAFNEAYSHLGYSPRTECVFTTGNSNDAIEYGNLHLCFPIGKFDFLYSPEIHDLYLIFGEEYDAPPALEKAVLSTIEYGLENKTLTDSEDTWHCLEHKLWYDALKSLPSKEQIEVIKEALIKADLYKSDDMAKAIKSYSEIMINCDDYYLVSVEKLRGAGITSGEFLEMI